MGRPKKTVVRILQDSDLRIFAEAENLYSDKNNRGTRTRILREFLAFCDINTLDLGKGLRAWVGQQRSNHVCWSSLNTYVGYIYGALSARIPLGDVGEWDHVSAVVSAAHAASKTASAVTATVEQFKKLASLIPAEHYWALQGIRYTGARLADIRRWTKEQALLSRNSIRVEVRITKGRRSRKKRRILRLRPRDVFGHPLPRVFLKKFNALATEAPVIARATTVNAVNRSLRTACQGQGWKRLTTYSFRHLFIKDILVFVDFDFEKGINYTLHCGVDILAAHDDKLEYNNPT